MFYTPCRKSKMFIFVSFVLYVYRKIFSLLLFKIFWKFFLEGLGFKGRSETEQTVYIQVGKVRGAAH